MIIVNPYQELDIYSPDDALAYADASDKSTLDPHVFAGILT
jgi:myosin heavy subunit